MRSVMNRGALLFLAFFVIALLLWFFQAFRYNYSTVVNIPVEYDHIPRDIAVSDDLPTSLRVEIRDNGFALLNYRLKGVFTPIVLPVEINEDRVGHFGWNSRQIENEVVKKLNSSSRSFKIMSIYPSMISTDYSPKAKKEIPIEMAVHVIPVPGTIITDLKIDPETAIVYGSKAELDTLEIIPTDSITIDSILGDTNVKVRLRVPERTTLTPDFTVLHISTEQLSQVSFTLPLSIPEVKGKYLLRTFPTSVQVTCVIPNSRREDIKDSDIIVSVMADNIQSNPRGSLKVIVQKYPSYVQMIQTDPSEVEYLLEPR